MEFLTWVQTLDEAVYVSLLTNTAQKGMNPSVPSQLQLK